MDAKKLVLGLALSLFILSCSNDNTPANEMSQAKETAKTDAQIDIVVNDISDITDGLIASEGGMSGKSDGDHETFLPDCVAIAKGTDTETSWVRELTFDNCKLPNGNIIDGEIRIAASINPENHIFTISYTFNDFHHNGILVGGSKTVVREIKSTDALQTPHPVDTITINLTLTFPNGKVYHREGQRIRQMIEGFETQYIWHDDIFSITGSWTTISDNGTINSSITSPLIVKMNCHNIVKGTITITKNDKTMVLDYGNGECDKTATITVNDVTETISLGKK